MIVLCEDNEVQRGATRQLLENRGYRVRECSHGTEALALVRDRKCRVLVLDLVMPDTDGLGVLRQLHEDPACRDLPVPIVVTTAMPDPLPEMPGVALLLRKPFPVEKLIEAIEILAPLGNLS